MKCWKKGGGVLINSSTLGGIGQIEGGAIEGWGLMTGGGHQPVAGSGMRQRGLASKHGGR